MRKLHTQPSIVSLVEELFNGVYSEGSIDDIPPEDIKDFLKELYRLKQQEHYLADEDLNYELINSMEIRRDI